MSLQFACAKRPADGSTKGKKGSSAQKDTAMALLGTMAKREQSHISLSQENKRFGRLTSTSSSSTNGDDREPGTER